MFTVSGQFLFQCIFILYFLTLILEFKCLSRVHWLGWDVKCSVTSAEEQWTALQTLSSHYTLAQWHLHHTTHRSSCLKTHDGNINIHEASWFLNALLFTFWYFQEVSVNYEDGWKALIDNGFSWDFQFVLAQLFRSSKRGFKRIEDNRQQKILQM